jgi:hypothetical protein
MFAALYHFRNPDDSHILNVRNVTKQAIALYEEFYNKKYDDKFEGFPKISDESFQKLANHFKINIAIYTFNNTYHTISQEYFTQSSLTINLLLTNHGQDFHIMLIKDVESLTGMKYCPICKNVVCKRDPNHGDRVFEKHIDLHQQGLIGKKKCNLAKRQLPFCPNILKNRSYLYCLAHNCLEKYRPIQSYITYDFETFEERLNQDISTKTTINSILKPFSVAVCVNLIDEVKTNYSDIRQLYFYLMKFFYFLILSCASLHGL